MKKIYRTSAQFSNRNLNFVSLCILQVLSLKPTVMKTTLVRDVGVVMVVPGTGEINGKFKFWRLNLVWLP